MQAHVLGFSFLDSVIFAAKGEMLPLPSVRFKVTITDSIVPSSAQVPLILYAPLITASGCGVCISSFGGSVSTAFPSPISQDVTKNKDNITNKK